MNGGQGDVLDGVSSWISKFKTGQIVFDEGDQSKLMYRVEEGCVRLQVNSARGRRQIVTFLFPGDLFGYEVEKRVCAAEAVTDSVLRTWPVKAVLKVGSRRTDVTIRLMEASQHMFGQLAQHLEKVTHLPALERVIWFFSGLLSCPGLPRTAGRIHLPMMREDIADHLGLAPETLSRVIATLEKRGYLRRVGRRDIVLNARTFAFKTSDHADLKIRSHGHSS